MTWPHQRSMDILQTCTEVVVVMMTSDMGSQHMLGLGAVLCDVMCSVFQDEQRGLDGAQLHMFSSCLASNKTHLSSISHLVRISRLLLFNTVLQNRKTAIPKRQQTGHNRRYPAFYFICYILCKLSNSCCLHMKELIHLSRFIFFTLCPAGLHQPICGPHHVCAPDV